MSPTGRRRARIGIVGNITPPTGGAEVFLGHLLEHLIGKYGMPFSLARWREQLIGLGPESSFVYRFDDGPRLEARHGGLLRILYLFRISFSSSVPIILQLSWQTLRTCWFFWRERVRLIHCHLLVPNVYFACLAATALRIPWIVTIHGLVDITEAPSLLPDARGRPRGITGWEKRALVRMLGRASKVIGVSREICTACEHLGLRNVEQIGGAVDIDAFKPTDRPESGILFLGNLNRRKGFDLLLEAYASVRDQIQEPLLIAGKNPENMSVSVEGAHYLGDLDREEVRDQMQRCKMLVLPSLTEGLPLSVLEALACNKIVLASRVGELPYLIDHGRNGFLLRETTASAIAEALRSVFADFSATKRQLGDAPRRTAMKFSLAEVAARHAQLYRDSISDPSASWEFRDSD